MTKYTCEKCGKTFSQKSHYTNHLNKKFPCVKESKIKEFIDKAVEEKIKNVSNLTKIENFQCFIKETKILTENGYKNIEDILLTDKILNDKGIFQNILKLQNKIYKNDLYDLDVKYHPDIVTCSSEQQFYVREKSCRSSKGKRLYFFSEPKWKKISDLNKNDHIGMIINTNEIIPEFTFEKGLNSFKTVNLSIKLDKEDQWYMMGFFVGNGCIIETKCKPGRGIMEHTIYFSINHKSVEEVCKRIRKILPIKEMKSSTEKCKTLRCRDKLWFNIFKMFGKYAHGKLIPEWVQDAPINFIQEFINGYMKADGNIKKNGVHGINTVSYDLALGLQRLYFKLGYVASVGKTIRPKTCVIEGRTVNQRDRYDIRITPNKSRQLGSIIENNYVWFKIFKVSKKENNKTNFYDIQLENNDNFVISNLIAKN